jgi:[protein-PII] uridylyltransferase
VARASSRPEEFATFRRAEDFLWAVRCHLHFLTRRPVDQLTFDLQVEVAARMGYEGGEGRRAVERFMQDFFRTRRGWGSSRASSSPRSRPPRQAGAEPAAALRPQADRPAALRDQAEPPDVSDERPSSRPLNLLRIFEEALRTGTLLHPDAMRLIASHLHLIDDRLRHDPRANAIFLDLLLKHGNPERALRRMNELGVLAAFIPDFEPVVALMQFNMYHHFTVDEHTIQCISHLARIEKGELVEELPVASASCRAG